MFNAEFLITSLVVVLIPGTGVIYTVSTGIFMGWRASIAAALGCTTGIIPHLLASILGLSAILHMSAMTFQILKYGGALYLLYLAWSMWRETGSLTFHNPGLKKNYLQVVRRGFLINILNPKLSIFFLAFLPQFINTSSSPLFQLCLLSLVFMLMTLGVFILYGISAHGAGLFLTNSARVYGKVQRAFALVFAYLGLRLAATEQ